MALIVQCASVTCIHWMLQCLSEVKCWIMFEKCTYWFVPIPVAVWEPSCTNPVLLKATGLHSCMLLSFSQDMFLKHGLSDPPALWCVEEQEQPSRRQFYFNCYLPFLPVLHFPLPLEQINRKNVKGLTGKQLRFKLNSLQSVFTSLT